MPTAQANLHPAVQLHVDNFRERIDSHAVNVANWIEHTLTHGGNALRAVYQHDLEGFQSAFGTLTREVLHAVFGRMSPKFAFGETIETLADDYAASEAAKIYDHIAVAAGEVH